MGMVSEYPVQMTEDQTGCGWGGDPGIRAALLSMERWCCKTYAASIMVSQEAVHQSQYFRHRGQHDLEDHGRVLLAQHCQAAPPSAHPMLEGTQSEHEVDAQDHDAGSSR